MIIPHEKLSEQALNGLIEEFVTRAGTDTGDTDSSLENNVAMVKKQLKAKSVFVVYDPVSQTVNIVPREHLKTSDIDPEDGADA